MAQGRALSRAAADPVEKKGRRKKAYSFDTPGVTPYNPGVGLPVVTPAPFNTVPVSTMLGQPPAASHIPHNAQSQDALVSSMVYHMDKLANPGTVPKPGTLEGVRRMEEILAYLARFNDNHHVAMRPGGCGGKPGGVDEGSKWPTSPTVRHLPDPHRLRQPDLPGRRVFSAGRTWQGRRSRAGRERLPDMDILRPRPLPWGARWSLETRGRSSTHIETWRVNARNMAQQFAAVYGSELSGEGHSAIEKLRIMHIAQPRKFPLQFPRQAWGTLNHRWGQEIRELTNLLRMYAGAERATFDQLRTVGMTIREGAGRSVYQRPTTFDLKRHDGYFEQEALRKLMGEKEVAEWKQRHGGVPARTPVDRTGADGVGKRTPLGHPLAAAEYRISGATAPPNAQEKKICWGFNTHLGRIDNNCERAHEYYKNLDQLSSALWLVLTKRGGWKKRPMVDPEKVGDRIREIRQKAKAENKTR